MALLPTVKLRHPKKGLRIINVTDYQRDIAFWCRAGWKIVSIRGGDATDAEVREAARESDLNKFRLEDPEESRKRGDARRAYESRAMLGNVVTNR